MRTRITVAILGTLAAALLLTGVGTIVLDRISARADTEKDLRAQAEGLADLMAPTTGTGASLQRPGVTRLLKGFKLEGFGFMYIGPAGRVVGTPPDGVDPALVDPARLQAGETISGHRGRLVYAIAAAAAPRGTLVAILTRTVDSAPGRAFRWFALSAAFVLLVGVLVAFWVSNALTDRLRTVEQATERIAGGDFSTRLPPPASGAHDELNDLARAINTMAEQLDRSRGLEQQFLLSVSHDLRTPLTSIRGYAEAITDGTAPDAAAAAGVILGESRRLERLVRDLLDLARLDAHQFRLDLRPVAVSEVVTDTAEGFRPAAETAGIALVVDEDASAAAAVVDPDRLAQVVANLVENGMRYARAGLRVSTVPGPTHVSVLVADDGPGISPADLPHVFERLYVAPHQPTRTESGSGLGLAITRELVAAMGGTVGVESPLGPHGGTRLVVTLPRAG